LFSHGRHEVVVESAGAGSFYLSHRARDDGPAPTVAETLLVVSVIAVLAERVCGRPLNFGPDGAKPWRRDGRWSNVADGPVPKRFVLAGVRAAATAATKAGPIAENFVDALRARIAGDTLRRWTVAELAAVAGLTPRSLQRQLSARGLTFSRLVAEARLQTASEHLCNRSGPGLAEVGFLSGYADQAHFTRSFSAAVGTTPFAYRSSFGA
jgi:AraC-like DNA-binding protein